MHHEFNVTLQSLEEMEMSHNSEITSPKDYHISHFVPKTEQSEDTTGMHGLCLPPLPLPGRPHLSIKKKKGSEEIIDVILMTELLPKKLTHQ